MGTGACAAKNKRDVSDAMDANASELEQQRGKVRELERKLKDAQELNRKCVVAITDLRSKNKHLMHHLRLLVAGTAVRAGASQADTPIPTTGSSSRSSSCCSSGTTDPLINADITTVITPPTTAVDSRSVRWDDA
jgi:hypothetical protein